MQERVNEHFGVTMRERPMGITVLAVPGLVLLWIALPTRTAFVSRPVEPPSRRKT